MLTQRDALKKHIETLPRKQTESTDIANLLAPIYIHNPGRIKRLIELPVVDPLTPLMTAAKEGRLHKVQVLLNSDAISTINESTYSGKTAYDFAVANNFTSIADLLNKTIKIKQVMDEYGISFTQAEAYINLSPGT